MEFLINERSLPFPIYVIPFYFEHQPDNEIHFLIELHNGEAFCCKWLTVEKKWVITLMGGFPECLIETAYEVVERADIRELLREAVDVEEL
jgi:hypothetical protein